jgi:hypothetical protein
MDKLPTDRDIMRCIYEMYESNYPGATVEAIRGENDPYIEIDIPAIAARLRCKPELLFGRLYYFLDYKHRYRQDDGSLVPLFHPRVGKKEKVINFPYLASILAELDQEYRKQSWSFGFSIIALVLSLTSIAINFLRHP